MRSKIDDDNKTAKIKKRKKSSNTKTHVFIGTYLRRTGLIKIQTGV